MNPAFPEFHGSMPLTTVPPPDDYERALQRERLDASILRSLGEASAYRASRTGLTSRAWVELEQHVARASSLLWEVSATTTSLSHDYLAYCAYLAREIAITESLDLDPADAWARFEELAPHAVATLDEISGDLVSVRSGSNPIKRALATAFGAIRTQLVTACNLQWNRAA